MVYNLQPPEQCPFVTKATGLRRHTPNPKGCKMLPQIIFLLLPLTAKMSQSSDKAQERGCEPWYCCITFYEKAPMGLGKLMGNNGWKNAQLNKKQHCIWKDFTGSYNLSIEGQLLKCFLLFHAVLSQEKETLKRVRDTDELRTSLLPVIPLAAANEF